MLGEALLVIIPFLLVGWLGLYMADFCRARGMLAPVDVERGAHSKPTPHGGGLLVVAVTIPISLAVIWGLDMMQKEFLTALFLAAIPLAFMGWLDDVKHRSPLLRLGVHFICVALALAFLPQLFDIVPLWIEKIVLLCAWAWFVNLYNFMDGMDGLATSQAVFFALALMWFVPSLAPIAAVLAGASMGFLRVNWHPARVFLGDVGSTYLGFVFGGLLLVGLEWDTWRLAYPLFTLTLVFSADTTYALFNRVRQGHAPWLPHRDFWFHRAERAGYTHKQVVSRIMILNVILAFISWAGYVWNLKAWTLVLGMLVVLIAVLQVKKLEKNAGIRIEYE